MVKYDELILFSFTLLNIINIKIMRFRTLELILFSSARRVIISSYVEFNRIEFIVQCIKTITQRS